MLQQKWFDRSITSVSGTWVHSCCEVSFSVLLHLFKLRLHNAPLHPETQNQFQSKHSNRNKSAELCEPNATRLRFGDAGRRTVSPDDVLQPPAELLHLTEGVGEGGGGASCRLPLGVHQVQGGVWGHQHLGRFRLHPHSYWWTELWRWKTVWEKTWPTFGDMMKKSVLNTGEQTLKNKRHKEIVGFYWS